MTDIADLISRIENAAHEGAFGQNARPIPTDGQTAVGNYKVGPLDAFGLKLAIEQPRNSYRTGIDKKTGARWTSRLAAHYGYIKGTKGADGDPVDCFIGVFPQSERVWIINQHVNGAFDEHKVMLAFPDEYYARQAYLESYDKGWNGLHSIVPASLTQLKWWLKNGNLTKPLKPEHLPYDGLETMNQRVSWGENALPSNMTLDKVIYEIRRADGDNPLLLDSVSMADILEGADEILVFDALVSTQAQLERKMNALMAVMNRAGGDVKPLAMQISAPFKQNGVAQVAAVFELSDGQTVSIFFHNPDVTPAKIAPTDEMISWKWLLNKKDITIVVAPERGKDLNVREVATRIMKLAAKNSPAFQRANTKRAENMAAIESIKGEIVVLEKELADAQHELEVAKVEAEDRAANPTPSLQVQLERQAEEFGPNRDGFYGVISDGQDLPDDFMPQDNKQMDMAMKEIARESGQAFAFQVNASKDKPFRVIKTLVDAGSEVGSQWAETPEQAYDMLPETEEVDANIGREWNAKWGRQRIAKRLNSKSGDLYEVETIEDGSMRRYRVADIEETIKTDEYRLTPEYAAKKAEEEEIRKLRAERDARAKAKEDQANAEIAEFTRAKGMSTINSEKARQALIKQVSVNGVFDTRKNHIDKLVSEGRVIVNDDKFGRILQDSEGVFLDERQLTKTGLDYAEYLIGKSTPIENPNQPHIDTLQSIVDGQHDSEDLTALLDKIDRAAQALIDAGVAETYDDLIGKAAEHWAALDEKANG